MWHHESVNMKRRISIRRSWLLVACLVVWTTSLHGSDQPVAQEQSSLGASQLRTEYLNDPRGLDEQQPRLSWQVNSTARDQLQTAYRILVASDAARLAR